jgi:hypothetical protein
MPATSGLSILALGPVIGVVVVLLLGRQQPLWVLVGALVGELLAYTTLTLLSALISRRAPAGLGAYATGVSLTNRLAAWGLVLLFVLAVAAAGLLIFRLFAGPSRQGTA